MDRTSVTWVRTDVEEVGDLLVRETFGQRPQDLPLPVREPLDHQLRLPVLAALALDEPRRLYDLLQGEELLAGVEPAHGVRHLLNGRRLVQYAGGACLHRPRELSRLEK